MLTGYRNQRNPVAGFAVIESLVAIILISLGIIGMVNLQARAIQMNLDARYRADAAFLANDIIARLSVADPTQLPSYEHRPTGGSCNPGGADSASPLTTGWLTEVAQKLPNAAASRQQLTIDSGNRVVVVTLCWRSPSEPNDRVHRVTSQLQFQ